MAKNKQMKKYYYFKCCYRMYVQLLTAFFSFLGITLCIDSSCPKASSDFINLLDGLLQKDPQKRYVWIVF